MRRPHHDDIKLKTWWCVFRIQLLYLHNLLVKFPETSMYLFTLKIGVAIRFPQTLDFLVLTQIFYLVMPTQCFWQFPHSFDFFGGTTMRLWVVPQSPLASQSNHERWQQQRTEIRSGGGGAKKKTILDIPFLFGSPSTFSSTPPPNFPFIGCILILNMLTALRSWSYIKKIFSYFLLRHWYQWNLYLQ